MTQDVETTGNSSLEKIIIYQDKLYKWRGADEELTNTITNKIIKYTLVYSIIYFFRLDIYIFS